jgi:hypothetical protein
MRCDMVPRDRLSRAPSFPQACGNEEHACHGSQAVIASSEQHLATVRPQGADQPLSLGQEIHSLGDRGFDQGVVKKASRKCDTAGQ